MNFLSATLVTVLLALIANCGGPAPIAQPKPVDPCQQGGVSYAPVGKIAKMEEVALAQKRPYGTHVLVDASGNIQWALQSPNMNLDPFAGDGRWYRLDGTPSADHPDLFLVCAVSLSR
jgi:hypothetical protein